MKQPSNLPPGVTDRMIEEQAGGDDVELLEILGEGFHTAFRKGADGGGSHEVWIAIRNCTTYGDALVWFLWALRESGYDIVKK